jgi:hypothetical protein
LAVLDAFQTAREHLQKAEHSNIALAKAIEDLPSSGKNLPQLIYAWYIENIYKYHPMYFMIGFETWYLWIVIVGPVTNVDHDLLMLKATSQATISCLADCLSILQQQQIAAPVPRSQQTQQTPAVKKPGITAHLSSLGLSDSADKKRYSNFGLL